MVYNANTETFFYNDRKYSLESVSEQDTDKLLVNLVRLLRQSSPLEKMRLVPISTTRPIEDQQSDFNLFSLAMYQSLGQYKQEESVLFINVKSEWLLDNLMMLNQTDNQDNNSGIYTLDQQNNILLPSNPADPDIQTQLRRVNDSPVASKGSPDTIYTTRDMNGDKKIVTLMDAGVNNWKIVMVQPYRSVMAILTILASARLYRPIDKLVTQISGDKGSDEDLFSQKDEMAYVVNTYRSLKDKLTVLKSEQASKRNIVKEWEWISFAQAEVEMDNEVLAGVMTFSHANAFTTSVQSDVQITPANIGPAAPQNLAGVAGNQAVSLSWSPVAGADSYTVYKYQGASAPADRQQWEAAQASLTETANQVTGLTNGSVYSFAVTAVGTGGESEFSASATATPIAPTPSTPPTQPSNGSGGSDEEKQDWVEIGGTVDGDRISVALRASGMIQGRAGNRFTPNAEATRAEATVILLGILERMNE